MIVHRPVSVVTGRKRDKVDGNAEVQRYISVLKAPAVFRAMGSFPGIQDSRGGLESSAPVGMGAESLGTLVTKIST